MRTIGVMILAGVIWYAGGHGDVLGSIIAGVGIGWIADLVLGQWLEDHDREVRNEK